MDLKNAAIAIATDDGKTVSSHFGRAQYYEVIRLNDGKVVERERREKVGHQSLASEETEGHHSYDDGQSHEHRPSRDGLPDDGLSGRGSPWDGTGCGRSSPPGKSGTNSYESSHDRRSNQRGRNGFPR